MNRGLILIFAFILLTTLSNLSSASEKCYQKDSIINGNSIEVVKTEVSCTPLAEIRTLALTGNCVGNMQKGNQMGFNSLGINATRNIWKYKTLTQYFPSFIGVGTWDNWINITSWLHNSSVVGKAFTGTDMWPGTDLQMGDFDYSEEFELNANIGSFSFYIEYDLYNGIVNSGIERGMCWNSYNFLAEFFVYNNLNNSWDNFYRRNSTECTQILEKTRASTLENPNYVKNGKAKFKLHIQNSDNTASSREFGGYSFLLNNINYINCASLFAPVISNLPDQTIKQDTKINNKFIDLWSYSSDVDTGKERLSFNLTNSNSSLINCWIDLNRYVSCGIPSREKTGIADITICAKDPQNNFGCDTFRINVGETSLTILFVPFGWDSGYKDYSNAVDNLANYFLSRTPLANCQGQLKIIKIDEIGDYGKYWNGWKCDTKNVSKSELEECFYEESNRSLLNRIWSCGEGYSNLKDLKFDIVAGISDRNIGLADTGYFCSYNVAGWSNSQGGIPSAVAESKKFGILTHELGHQFGLQDQYCNCDNTQSERFCGTKVQHSQLRTELGCNPITGKGCCYAGSQNYKGCNIWCDGNFDLFGIDSDKNGTLDFGDRTIMSNKILEEENGHFDSNEYSYLQGLAQFSCRKSRTFGIKSYTPGLLSMEILFSIDDSDRVTLKEINQSQYPKSNLENSGDYMIRILNHSNDVLYQRNFSVDFYIFSDPPTIINQTDILERVTYLPEMTEMEIYHKNLLFSYNLSTFCNSNHVCDPWENYLYCWDCSSSSFDGFCNKQENDGCDLDCIEGLDADCVDLAIMNVSIEENITSGTKTKIIFNINNSGIENASFLIGLLENSSLTANSSNFARSNSLAKFEFNWTPKNYCNQEILISLDYENMVNEINKTNNQFVKNLFINIPGDVVFDKNIDIFDLAKVGLCYDKTSIGDCSRADTKKDGKIDIFDLATVGINFGKKC